MYHIPQTFPKPITPKSRKPIGLDPQFVIDRVNQHSPLHHLDHHQSCLSWDKDHLPTRFGTPLITNSITHPLSTGVQRVGCRSHSTDVKIFNDHRSIFTNWPSAKQTKKVCFKNKICTRVSAAERQTAPGGGNCTTCYCQNFWQLLNGSV